MSDRTPESWLDAQLRELPLPEALVERLRAIAREEEGKGVQLSDAAIDRLLLEVPVPEGLVESIRALARRRRRGISAATVDRVLSDVPVPANLTAKIRAAIEDEALDEAVRNIPVPAPVTARARVIPRERPRVHPVLRGIAAVLLFCVVGASYFGGIAAVTWSSRPEVNVSTAPMAVELGPLELESVPDDETVAVIGAPSVLGEVNRVTPSDEITLEPFDQTRTLGPAGELAQAFEMGFQPLQSAILARWKPLGAQWADDALPDLETVLAPSARGIEAPLVRGFNRVFLFKNGVFPMVDPSADPALAVSATPLTTSTASYDLTRRLCDERRLPDPGEVRVEDFLAAIDYQFTPPQAEQVGIRAAAGPSIFGRQFQELRPQLLQVAAQAGPAAPRESLPTHLTIAIDVSASMAWNGRIDMAQRALAGLLEHLGAGDRLTLVAFNDEIVRLVENVSIDDEKEREKLLETIDGLHPSGGTDIGAGLRDAANRSFAVKMEGNFARRMVLLTDGRVGLPPDEAEKIEAFLRDVSSNGLQVDVIDLSQQEDFPDYMERLASAGSGQMSHGNSADEIRWGLVQSLIGKSPLVATKATLQVTFNPDAVAAYRLFGHEPSAAGAAPTTSVSGDLRTLQAATALYEVWLKPTEADDVATVRLTWTDPHTGAPRQEEQRISRLQFASSWAESPLSLQAATIAAQTAEVLRESAFTVPANREFRNILRAASEVNSNLEQQESFRRFVTLVHRLNEVQTRGAR